jgi:hypothetical protein
MKRVGKRQGGVLQRLGNWIAGTPPQTFNQAISSNTSASQHGITTSVADWPSSQDDVPLSGARFVDGQCCRTVGEYKAACAKFYGT